MDDAMLDSQSKEVVYLVAGFSREEESLREKFQKQNASEVKTRSM